MSFFSSCLPKDKEQDPLDTESENESDFIDTDTIDCNKLEIYSDDELLLKIPVEDEESEDEELLKDDEEEIKEEVIEKVTKEIKDEIDPAIKPVKEEVEKEEVKKVKEKEETKIEYAPRQRVVRGSRKVIVITLKWNPGPKPKEPKNASAREYAQYRKRFKKWVRGGKFADLGTAKRIARDIEKFYDRNSRGLLKLKTETYLVNVDLRPNSRNLGKAERQAMNKYPGADMYAIVSNLNQIEGKKPSNAGSGVAHLRGTSMRTACHEIGHLLGLGHAGAYIKGSLDQYGDAHSVMSRVPSSFLTAPQYYKLGWLPEKEVALHDPEKNPEMVYELKKVNQFNKKEGLAGVLVKSDGKREVWVSRPPQGANSLVLHLAIGGSSQRVKMFGKQFHDKRFTGLLIKRIGKTDDDLLQVTIEKNLGNNK